MTREEELLKNSPAALPDDPSMSGWSTPKIKEKFYAGLVLLLRWLEDLESTEGGHVEGLQESINGLSTLLNNYIQGTSAMPKAIGDGSGNNIEQTYVKNNQAVHNFGNESIDGVKRMLKYIILEGGISDGDITLLINQLVSKGFLSEQLQDKATKQYVDQGLVTKESSVNKKTVINTPSNEYYPTVKAVIDFVNSSINALASYPIKKNAQGDNFATKAELLAATVFYSGGQVRVPTKLDYTIVDQDESRPVYTAGVIDIYREYTTTAEYVDYYVLVSGTYTKVTNDNKDSLSIVPGTTVPYTMSIPSTRYSYNNGWEFDHIVNTTPFTNAQEKALNSGIDSDGVQQIAQNKQDIAELDENKVSKDEAMSYFKQVITPATFTISPTDWNENLEFICDLSTKDITVNDGDGIAVYGDPDLFMLYRVTYGVGNNINQVKLKVMVLPEENMNISIEVSRLGE